MTHPRNDARAVAVAALALLCAVAVHPASAAGYSMTLTTNEQAYSGTEPIVINGTISPAPGANTAVVIQILNPSEGLADIDEAIPNAVTGAFSYVSIPGGNPAWVGGTFTVNATWGGDGATTSQVTTFAYTPPVTSSSSSSSSGSSSSVSTSSSSSSSSSGSSSSSSSSSSGSASSSESSSSSSSAVPEFPTGALAALVLFAAALVAGVSRRFAGAPGAPRGGN